VSRWDADDVAFVIFTAGVIFGPLLLVALWLVTR
jgi:hypothetical protein